MPAAVKQASFSGDGAYRMLTEAPKGLSNYKENVPEFAMYRASLFHLVNEINGSHFVTSQLYCPP